MEVRDQHHSLATVTPGKNHDKHCTGGWLCPRDGLVFLEERNKCWSCRDSNTGWSSLYLRRYTVYHIPTLLHVNSAV